jgi:hypothetical protein
LQKFPKKEINKSWGEIKMTYEKIKNLTPENFKRLCGVRKETFSQMVKLVLKNA